MVREFPFKGIKPTRQKTRVQKAAMQSQETGNQSLTDSRTQMTMKVRIFEGAAVGARTGAGGPMSKRTPGKRMLRATDEVMEHRLPTSSQRTGVFPGEWIQGGYRHKGRVVEADTKDHP